MVDQELENFDKLKDLILSHAGAIYGLKYRDGTFDVVTSNAQWSAEPNSVAAHLIVYLSSKNNLWVLIKKGPKAEGVPEAMRSLLREMQQTLDTITNNLNEEDMYLPHEKKLAKGSATAAESTVF